MNKYVRIYKGYITDSPHGRDDGYTETKRAYFESDKDLVRHSQASGMIYRLVPVTEREVNEALDRVNKETVRINKEIERQKEEEEKDILKKLKEKYE